MLIVMCVVSYFHQLLLNLYCMYSFENHDLMWHCDYKHKSHDHELWSLRIRVTKWLFSAIGSVRSLQRDLKAALDYQCCAIYDSFALSYDFNLHIGRLFSHKGFDVQYESLVTCVHLVVKTDVLEADVYVVCYLLNFLRVSQHNQQEIYTMIFLT